MKHSKEKDHRRQQKDQVSYHHQSISEVITFIPLDHKGQKVIIQVFSDAFTVSRAKTYGCFHDLKLNKSNGSRVRSIMA